MPQMEQLKDEFTLPGAIAGYLKAVNTGASEDFPANFADGAVVVDVNRELRGIDAIAAWAASDIFAADVRFEVLDVSQRQGQTIIKVKIDGTFDRTGLPDPLVMNHAFRLADGKIAELLIGF